MITSLALYLGKAISRGPNITPQPSIIGLKKGFVVQKWDDSLHIAPQRLPHHS